MSQLPSIPYVHIYNDLSCYYEFLGERFNIKSHEHEYNHKTPLLKWAKRIVQKKYYDYHHSIGLLPEIFVTKIDVDKYEYEYFVGDEVGGHFVKRVVAGSLYKAWEVAISNLLSDLNVKGVK